VREGKKSPPKKVAGPRQMRPTGGGKEQGKQSTVRDWAEEGDLHRKGGPGWGGKAEDQKSSKGSQKGRLKKSIPVGSRIKKVAFSGGRGTNKGGKRNKNMGGGWGEGGKLQGESKGNSETAVGPPGGRTIFERENFKGPANRRPLP